MKTIVHEHIWTVPRLAVLLVADMHPDVNADLIADSYDAFDHEHVVTEHPNPYRLPLTTVRV
ncbi:hypothetical protein BTO20_34070 [Mycobacterium dioxanotrophicus]|uniref:Uncharacterized protein n=1 Tax=Mycobacterium dioxanotrophicus TaxID=482462 RepID=A0A1Y0CCC4_9MYCO|nr:hypothetical protein [Mycobacterium dioxanotrophicus]ART72918.1 hypothetical protein BTO20_34070 [Mycobacterium dioxanotrophicus]